MMTMPQPCSVAHSWFIVCVEGGEGRLTGGVATVRFGLGGTRAERPASGPCPSRQQGRGFPVRSLTVSPSLLLPCQPPRAPVTL